MTYHNEDFAVVGSDSRVSIRQDGKDVALPCSAKKFVVLRPDLVLAGSSSLSAVFDRAVFEHMLKFVELLPAASFEGVVAELRRAVPQVEAALADWPAWVQLVASDPDGHAFVVAVVGYDRAQRRVRKRVFELRDGVLEESEHISGATASGFIELEDRVSQRMLASMGAERNPVAAERAMRIVAAEVAATRPELIGPPYSFHLITGENEGSSSQWS